jgi:MOSC domain-containing protein YiiM
MFGENLTIEGMEESKMLIGSIYKVGEAQIQVCQPRQPCFKLGIRFNTQAVLKPFINEPFSGIYFRVIQGGKVKPGDALKLIIDESESPSIAEVYRLMYQKTQGAESLIDSSIACKFLPDGCKDRIKQTQIA